MTEESTIQLAAACACPVLWIRRHIRRTRAEHVFLNGGVAKKATILG
jgi:hypothetical protein